MEFTFKKPEKDKNLYLIIFETDKNIWVRVDYYTSQFQARETAISDLRPAKGTLKVFSPLDEVGTIMLQRLYNYEEAVIKFFTKNYPDNLNLFSLETEAELF